MRAISIQDRVGEDISPDRIQAQMESMIEDEVFRSSKRSVAFLKHVVTEALHGSADQIKERTIGVEVFGRSASYDTNVDHIVRTAATELRKRLAIYYGDQKHRSELRIGLVPGSYVPKFTLPLEATPPGIEDVTASDHRPFALPRTEAAHPSTADLLLPVEPPSEAEPERVHRFSWLTLSVVAAFLLLAIAVGWRWLGQPSADYLFWKPVLDTPGPVLLAVGDVPNGPPSLPESAENGALNTPVPSAGAAQTVPLADAMTIARVVGALEGRRKSVIIRRESASSFSDLRQGAVVLVGAFNNEWSLRLTHSLRYSLAMDPDRHLVYIKDAQNPSARNWSWATNQPRDLASGINSPRLRDYALISRIQSPETGHLVVVIGGLYTYGTEAAGEFLTNPDLMRELARRTRRLGTSGTLQIVIGTTVTDGTPGPPGILAISTD
jgi:hypothetical protein